MLRHGSGRDHVAALTLPQAAITGAARTDLETVVAGKIQVGRIERGGRRTITVHPRGIQIASFLR